MQLPISSNCILWNEKWAEFDQVQVELWQISYDKIKGSLPFCRTLVLSSRWRKLCQTLLEESYLSKLILIKSSFFFLTWLPYDTPRAGNQMDKFHVTIELRMGLDINKWKFWWREVGLLVHLWISILFLISDVIMLYILCWLIRIYNRNAFSSQKHLRQPN